MLVKPFDFGIIAPVCGIVLASFVFAYSGGGNSYTINLKSDGGDWVFPHDAAETLSLAGPLGETIVEIRSGSARVLVSPCANQTCVAAGPVRSHGQWTACLPNRVMVYIGRETEDKTDVDALVW